MALCYASGTWQVKEGREEEFIERWREFLEWTRETFPAMRVANLLRDSGVPGHYLSFSEWADESSRQAWKQAPDFETHIGACVALCENMTGADYDVALSVGAQTTVTTS